jgi:aspartyl-tRNA synthetase
MAPSKSEFTRRTHTCGELREHSVDQTVTINGWVDTTRDHHHFVFADVRDRYGVTQVFFGEDSEAVLSAAKELRQEDVVSVTGRVRLRPEDNINLDRATGRVEMVAERLEVLNRAETPPFPIREDQKVSEELRLRYRYLDLRRPQMQRNLMFRHQFFHAVREDLDRQNFVEVETPMLTRAMPEGARDYLVPSRVHPGSFYALPQSPQLFKQLLMTSGYDRYYQVARCLRDEDLRADRQPEFTQLDLEMSFVSEDTVFETVESALCHSIQKTQGIEVPQPFPRLRHADAMLRYGSEKPDLRNNLHIEDVSTVAAATSFKVFQKAVEAGGVVRALPVPGAAELTRKEIDGLEARAKEMGAKGLAWCKVGEAGELQGGISKFLQDEGGGKLVETLGLSAGSAVFFLADKVTVACAALSEVRRMLGERFGGVRSDDLALCWVVDFPLFEWDEDLQQFQPAQHAFTTPVEEYEGQMAEDPGKVRARAYDLVLNGWELGSGGIRIHNRDLQQRVFDVLKISADEARSRFGFLLDAFEYGAPPHGGIGIGLDRLIAILLGEDNIREVIAFPKTASAACLMTGSPAEVETQQLEELQLKTVPVKPAGE